MTTVTFFLCPRLAGYTRVQAATNFSLNTFLKCGISLTKDVHLNVRFRPPHIFCLYNRQSQHNGRFKCVLQLKVKYLNTMYLLLSLRTRSSRFVHSVDL